MEIKEAREILSYHNQWRKGADIKMTNPKQLSAAIDRAIEVLKKEELRAGRKMSREELQELAKQVNKRKFFCNDEAVQKAQETGEPIERCEKFCGKDTCVE